MDTEQKKRIFILFKDKKKSKIAKALDIFFILVLLLSISVFCAQSTQIVQQSPSLATSLFWVEFATVIIFIAELALNCLNIESWKELFTWYYIIDLLSIVPFLLEVIVNAASNRPVTQQNDLNGLWFLRVLRASRVIRLFKLFRLSSRLRSIGHALKESLDGIGILLLVILCLTIFYSTLMFYAEQSMCYYVNYKWLYTMDDTESSFQSIPTSFFTMVLSLTGNPPEYPRSYLGQAVMVMAMVTYLLIVAFPLTLMTMAYNKQAKLLADKIAKKKEEKLLKERSKLFPTNEIDQVLKTIQEEKTSDELFVDPREAQEVKIPVQPTATSPVLKGKNTSFAEMESQIATSLGKKQTDILNPIRMAAVISSVTSKFKSPTEKSPLEKAATIDKQLSLSRTPTAGSFGNVIQSGAFENLGKVSLEIVDWSYNLGAQKRSEAVEDENDEVQVVESGGDTLKMTIAVKNPGQFRRLMKVLSEF